MGINRGFDIVRNGTDEALHKERHARFIQRVLRKYEDEEEDFNVVIRSGRECSYIEFLVGEHPAIPYKAQYFLTFTSKVSGSSGSAAERYIIEVQKIAREVLGDQVRPWMDDREPDSSIYSWDQIREAESHYRN